MDYLVQALVHAFTVWGILIIYGISDMELHSKIILYRNPGLVHTCINLMLMVRSFSLFCCLIMIVCIYIFVCMTLVSGTLPKLQYMEKLPGIKKFINKKSREYNTSKDGEDAECSICLQLFSESPDKMIAELKCSNKHKFH